MPFKVNTGKTHSREMENVGISPVTNDLGQLGRLQSTVGLFIYND